MIKWDDMYKVLSIILTFDYHKWQQTQVDKRVPVFIFPVFSLTFYLESSFKLIQKRLCNYFWVNPVKFSDFFAIIGCNLVTVNTSFSLFLLLPSLCSSRDRAVQPVWCHHSYWPGWCCGLGWGWGLITYSSALVCLSALMTFCFRCP